MGWITLGQSLIEKISKGFYEIFGDHEIRNLDEQTHGPSLLIVGPISIVDIDLTIRKH